MIWLLGLAVVVLVAALVLGRPPVPPDPARYRTMVELHGIRKRQEVAQVKHEIRRDAAVTRRELREELGSLRRQERKS
jgi:hypothetical protein